MSRPRGVDDKRPVYEVEVLSPTGQLVTIKDGLDRAAAIPAGAAMASKRRKFVRVIKRTASGGKVSVAEWRDGKRVK